MMTTKCLELIEQMKVTPVCLHFHGSGEKIKKRNALDDNTGRTTGASVLKEKSDRGEVNDGDLRIQW